MTPPSESDLLLRPMAVMTEMAQMAQEQAAQPVVPDPPMFEVPVIPDTGESL